MSNMENKYLKILAKQYPTIREAATEIINLQAILSLPKGTEHFITDIHGEHEQFNHVLKNGSGAVRRKIEDVFGDTLKPEEKRTLATLIYYPKEKLELISETEEDMDEWYAKTLKRLVQVVKKVTSKYTRSKVRKAIPKDFVYVIEELITEKAEVSDKDLYYHEIIQTIVRIGESQAVIEAMCQLIQRLIVDHLHVLGDIFDRGSGPHHIIDTLQNYHSVDIQWGNHDLLWMGAASGNEACIANVIRISAKYGNLDVLEEGYGINLMPLASFALKEYGEVNRDRFSVKPNDHYDMKENDVESKMHKAITILQFKLEAKLIKENPTFKMEDRLLLHKMDLEKGTVEIEGETYTLLDTEFPTIDCKDPYRLTEEEEQVVERLRQAFLHSDKLQRHVAFLYEKGNLYKVYNNNLLYHGCVPINEDGTFTQVDVYGEKYAGKKLYDKLEEYVRLAYFAKEGTKEKDAGRNLLWYLWSGPVSPAFGRSKMSTFERYLVKEKETHKEHKNAYYHRIDDDDTIEMIMEEFGLNKRNSHIINGHVPVELKKGENPVKCNGKLLIIDGGFSKAYQSITGIAGYTLVSNSQRMRLVSHEKFESKRKAIIDETDIISDALDVEIFIRRRCVGDTDIGKELKENIADLEELLSAYKNGTMLQKGRRV
ncbi:MAG: fructose-1,6-bisphosphatase [Lachnospiraceae bacterium]|nr:fructose-1,6-bisphosphatase [Lachnospiraceae bacterium]